MNMNVRGSDARDEKQGNNKEAMDALVQDLMEHETLNAEQINEVLSS